MKVKLKALSYQFLPLTLATIHSHSLHRAQPTLAELTRQQLHSAAHARATRGGISFMWVVKCSAEHRHSQELRADGPTALQQSAWVNRVGVLQA